jgi:hypothetical protein
VLKIAFHKKVIFFEPCLLFESERRGHQASESMTGRQVVEKFKIVIVLDKLEQ